MKFNYETMGQKSVAVLIFLVAQVGLLKDVRGELVFEDASEPSTVKETERLKARENSDLSFEDPEEKTAAVSEETLPSAPVQSSAPAQQVAAQPQMAPAAPVQTQTVVAAPVAVAAAEEKPRKELSRSESLRRHRVRQEVKNEDRLTERLEELRLKDEVKRLDQIMSNATPVQAAPQPQPEQVSAVEKAPAQLEVVKVGSAKEVNVQKNESVAEVITVKNEEPAKKTMGVGVTPRVGLGGILKSNFEVSSRISYGLTVNADLTEVLGLELGYTRSEYNLSAGNAFSYGGYGLTMQTLSMYQNVFDAGGRLYIMGKSSSIRPFFSGGVGYYRNNIRLDQNTMNYIYMYNPTMNNDYTISGFLGYLGFGTELKITDHIGVSGLFRYNHILSSMQSNPISSAAFINPYAAQSAMFYANDPRLQASRAFGKGNFYTFHVGLNVSF